MLDTAFGLVAILLMVGALAVLLRQLFRQAPQPQHAESASIAEVEGPKCRACTEPATEPAPHLERGRGSVVRDFLGMPPTYRRVIDRSKKSVFCSSHAHVADAELAAFVSVEIRSVMLQAYAQIATRVAAFECEELFTRVENSLTSEQSKKAQRKSIPKPAVRLVSKNGTDDAPG